MCMLDPKKVLIQFILFAKQYISIRKLNISIVGISVNDALRY